MIVPERSWASRASRDNRARPVRKRVMIALATPLLAAGFILAGTPTASASATVATNHKAVAFDTDPCRGGKSGVCPMFTIQQDQPDRQDPAPQVPEL